MGFEDGLYSAAFFFAAFFLGLASSVSASAGAGAAAGFGAPTRSKPLVTFSSINFFTNASARVSVWANNVVTSNGVLRPAEKSVQKITYGNAPAVAGRRPTTNLRTASAPLTSLV